MWTEDFKEALEGFVESTNEAKSYSNASTESRPEFTLTFDSEKSAAHWLEPCKPGEALTRLEVALKMYASKPLAVSNMHLFDGNGRIKKYASAAEIILEFFDIRLGAYERRKLHMLSDMKRRLFVLEQKTNFVDLVTNGTLDLTLIEDAGGDGETEDTSTPSPASHPLAAYGLVQHEGSFGFLLSMPMSSMTKKRKLALERERDALKQEIESLSRVTSEEMYSRDLVELREKLKSVEQLRMTEH